MTAPPFPAAAIEAAREDAKAWLRMHGAGEDALVERLAASALALGEAFTGTAWIARDWQDVVEASADWRPLMATPVTAIAAVEGLAADGSTFALAAEEYAIDIDARGMGWVRVVAPGAAERLRVSYGAGAAAEWGELPPPLAQGAVLLVAHLFANRGSERAPPAAVSALWRPWRQVRLSAAVHA